MSEIFPLHVKGVATGVCVLTNWLMAFLVTKEFSSLMVSAGPRGLPVTKPAEKDFLELLLLQETWGPWPCMQAEAPAACDTCPLGQGVGWAGEKPGCDRSGASRLSRWKDSRLTSPTGHWGHRWGSRAVRELRLWGCQAWAPTLAWPLPCCVTLSALLTFSEPVSLAENGGE